MSTQLAVAESPNPSLVRDEDEECLATWWQQATPGTSYWRCLVPARYLPGQVLPFTNIDLLEDESGTPVMPRQRGTAIWQFLGDSRRSRIALGMQELYGTRTFMEVDDNYLRAAPHMYGKRESPWKPKIADDPIGYTHERHRLVTPELDGIICSTEYLAEQYDKYNDNVYVCPNSIDPIDWEYERAEDDGVFRIVYYGSPSHVADAPIVTDALKWAARQPGVEIWTVGFEVPSWSFRHHYSAWADSLEEARQKLFRFDLGIAPLKSNPWADGKSDIKVMEYAMAGVLPLMSRVESHKPWFDVAPDLVLKKDDWMNAIRWAVKNPEEVKARAAEIKSHILENRTIHQSIGAWREVLNA